MAKKFNAPTTTFNTLIQSATTDQPTEPKEEFYRFNLKMPMSCKDYLQEMAWRQRTTITAYLTELVMKDMELHPEWKDAQNI